MGKPERDARYNAQRQWQHLYNDPRWHAARARQLVRHPLCAWHEKRGELVAAAVVHHVQAHKGDEALFFSGQLESLCKPCHDGDAQQQEARGYSTRMGVDGWPADERHPVNTGVPVPRWGFSIPAGVRPSAVPVHLVCGAPGAGKTTYVREQAKPADTVIDMDDIRQRLGFTRYSPDPTHLRLALRERDRLVRSLAQRVHGHAWLIVMAPTAQERGQWVSALGNVTVHSIDTPASECIRRIYADPTRRGQHAQLIAAVDSYFARRQDTLHKRNYG